MRTPPLHHLPQAGLVTIFLSLLISTSSAAYIALQTFSVRYVLGDFGSATFTDDNTIVCDVPAFTIGDPCPPDAPQPITDKDSSKLYPIDSKFGFVVVDFAGAAEEARNNNYQEGFVGNVLEGDNVIGLKVSNSATDVYKIPPPLCTWCHGIGANSAKCSTKYFSIMERILTCHKAIP